MPGRSYDAVVVGAGIVGAACARQLVLDGLKVAVCEASEFAGGGATAAGMGHLAVMDDSEAQFALTNYSQQLWRGLSEELPVEAEYLECGSLWVAADEEEMAEVHRKHDFYQQRGVPTDVLDGKQVAEMEPNLRPGLAGGLLMSADTVCYPPCAARYLIDQVTGAGGDVFFGKAVKAFSDGGVEFDKWEAIHAGIVVLATGTAALKLIPSLPIAPRKGHLLITDRYPEFIRHQIIELGYLKSAHAMTTDSVAFNAQPRKTGQVLIGSSRQFGADDPAIEQQILARMLGRALEYMPGLQNLNALRTWTGFRAATPDKLPLVGRCPGYENVYLATGHEGLGISTSLGTARLLSDMVCSRLSAIDREPYSPSRSFAH